MQQEAQDATGGARKPQEAAKRRQETARRLLGVARRLAPWRLQAAPGACPPGAPWLLLAAPGASWQLWPPVE